MCFQVWPFSSMIRGTLLYVFVKVSTAVPDIFKVSCWVPASFQCYKVFSNSMQI
jgi:hypothetical protein